MASIIEENLEGTQKMKLEFKWVMLTILGGLVTEVFPAGRHNNEGQNHPNPNLSKHQMLSLSYPRINFFPIIQIPYSD